MRRFLRAARIVLRDQRIPRPLRWLAALALMPVPGPVDEAALLVLVPLLFAFHRGPMREAWRAAARS
jgi:hypothetical protein